MKPWAKSAIVAGVAGVLTFAVVFAYNYSYLVAHQPSHQPGAPLPPDVTGFPPSAAWIVAAPCAVVAFVIVFIVALAAGKFAQRRRVP